MTNEIKKIACLGAGVIGSGWATNFLMKGIPTKVYTRRQESLQRVKNAVEKNLDFLVKKGFLHEEVKNRALEMVEYTTDLKTAVTGVQFIQESLPEEYDLKHAVMAEVEKYAEPDAIIATSTSGLLITEIAKPMRYPERLVGGHPYNPPHLIPLVEIVKGEKTSDAVVQAAYEFYVRIGKEPVVLNKEVSGFIANRLQLALYREAVDLVTKGVCSVEDIDKAVVYGPGLRYAALGPNLAFHLGGGEKGIKGLMSALKESTEMRLRDMATWSKEPEGWPDVAYEGVLREIENRPPELGKTVGEIAEFRDTVLLELLKLHRKI
ncbi:3-hydroxyacyl-CoA dehydrogenase family protein [Moorella sulfitireducens]|uniref:3-hydroxyacyl-CoA dehydrogenase family protein n=1 Tax=Neomoorella sulfitireducens TaxID=2972948 RepID=UPI0021ABFD37|nr:3-hydroxyacyl-CoA dehydrogenase family protein [Moorella sulfitireducens]